MIYTYCFSHCFDDNVILLILNLFLFFFIINLSVYLPGLSKFWFKNKMHEI